MKMWIARDRVGIGIGFHPQLALFEEKPFTSEFKEGMWFTRGHYYVLPEDRFPEVTFDNSPMEVELKLVK